uniref:hypothetical protein n=1 Tax=Paenarthrobacter ureafaciens TaxID=37931 RepID=UPI003F4999BE
MADNSAARRFIADAEDMGIGIGPDNDLRFLSMGLLSKLRGDGLTDSATHARLPRNGRIVYDEAELGPAEPSSRVAPET